MKTVKLLALVAALGVCLLGGTTWAAVGGPGFGRPQLPADVQAELQKLKADKAAFITQQQALLKQLKAATTKEDRQALRDQLKENREKFIESQKALKEDIRDRMQELRKEFKNQREQMLNEAKEKAKDAKTRKGEN